MQSRLVYLFLYYVYEPNQNYNLLQRLKYNWSIPVGFNTHKQIICDSVDVNAATHCQVDDDYLAVKNTDGVLKIWSKNLVIW